MALNSNALTTLDFAKTYLKVPSGNTTFDTLIEFWINTASQYLEAETNRKLKAQSLVEYHHGRSSNLVLLREWPVNSITELRIDFDSKFTDANTLIDVTEYAIADDENSLLLINRTFPNGYRNVKITYNAGYTTVPSDLENSCLWLVTYYHEIRNSQDIGRVSKSKGDESVSISQTAPQDVKDTIARYKRSEFLGDTQIRNR